MHNREDWIIKRLEAFAQRCEMLGLNEYLAYRQNWRRRLLLDFVSGIARGIGFSIGFTVLGALVLYFLRNAALANLPVIGRFLAELVRIVERSL